MVSPLVTPYPDSAPLVTAEPGPDSPFAFNQDEFVSLWCNIYDLLLKLNYIRRDDVAFPQEDTGRHAGVDRQRLRGDLGMSSEAVSLIERLPFPRLKSDARMQIFNEAMAINYLVDEDLRRCRDPHEMRASSRSNSASGSASSYLLPDDVALTLPYEGEGLTWILDLKYNAIRSIRGLAEPPEKGVHVPDDFQLERPDDPNHYRNWPAYHAPSILRRYAQDLRGLEIVPRDTSGEWFAFSTEIAGQIIGKALRKYGWPGADFQVDAWARDSEQVYRDTDDEEERYEKTFDPHKFGDDRKELIARWIENPDLIPDVAPNGTQ